MTFTIRLADESDAEQIAAIYAPIVKDTSISFELVPPTADEFRDRIRTVLGSHVWLVCETQGVICGYAYATKFRPREAYQWTAEVTVYIHPRYQRQGLAVALYRSLLEILTLQGYRTVIAVIALPNVPSVKVHERLGFRSIGVLRSVGHKLGLWHDTGWWQLDLPVADGAPVPPRPVAVCRDMPEWPKALRAGLAVLEARHPQ